MTRSGIDHFFAGDQEYNYMTLRVMGDSPGGGVEVGEVLLVYFQIAWRPKRKCHIVVCLNSEAPLRHH